MKKKLMKMALCALALLPMGAWADGIDFGTEVTVSTETLWIFDNAMNFPEDMDINSISVIKDSEGTESAYIRAWNARHAKIADADGVADFKKYDGTTVSITKGLTLTKAADVSKLTPTTSAGVSSETCTANGLFGINAEVPGTIYAYVKGKGTENEKLRLYHTCYPNSGGTALSEKEILATGDPQVMALTSTGKGTFYVTDPYSDFVIYAILFVPTTSTGISDVTTWTFENYQPISFFKGNVTDLSNGLFARCYNENTGTLKVASQDDLTSWTFADGWRVSNLSQCFTLGKLANATGNVEPGVSNNTMEGSLAFKVTTAGKVYVVASSSATNQLRIYNYAESTLTQKLVKAITETPDEYSADVVAGTIYIAHQTAGAKVYAVRFVPTTVADVTSWVYVGATGYATYANNKTLDVPTLPDGLTAYAASAGDDGHSVKLTERTGIRQSGAYVVMGTPGTNYELTHSGTDLTSDYNGGNMKRAATYPSTNIPATDGGKYNYILAAEGGVAKFFAPDGASKLHSTKAFLQVNTELTPATGDSKGFEIIFGKSEDSETTAIEGIAPVSAENGKYYNLMGVEVAHPTKGVYIVNGKKVVVK